MSRSTALTSSRRSSRRTTIAGIALVVLAATLIVAEWVTDPSSAAAGSAFIQAVLALVCLVSGAVYVLDNRRNGTGATTDEAVIDLRDEQPASSTGALSRPIPQRANLSEQASGGAKRSLR